MKIELKTLTPIWTGDIDRQCRTGKSGIKESGIMGSLRWWYEMVIRGHGEYACDPHANPKCSFDYDSFRKNKDLETGLKTVCPACRLFGCEGWSGKLILRVHSDQAREVRDQLKIQTRIQQRSRKIEGFCGCLTIAFQETKPLEPQERSYC